jgi:hypothetical protein
MVATWTDAYATPGVPAEEPSSNVFLLDSVGTRGLGYIGPVPPSFPATVNFYAAGGDPAAFGDYQGTAVCSWDPSLPQQYISFNGSGVFLGDGVQTVFIQEPGVVNSTFGGPPELFRLRFLAFYGLNDIPQTDFPPISGGSMAPPPPPNPAATWTGTGNLTWTAVATPTPTYPGPINVVFPPNGGITPSSALAHLFNIKHYMLLLSVQDQFGNNPRNVMLTWNEKDWVVTSQSVNLTRIAQQKVESKFTAWGTDGTNLFPLFQQASGNLTKTLTTKTYGIDTMLVTKQLRGLWTAMQDNTAAQSGVTVDLTFTGSGVALQPADPTYAEMQNLTLSTGALVDQNPSLPAPQPYWSVWGSGSEGFYFNAAQLTFTSTSPDFTVGDLVIGYTDSNAVGI